MSASDNTPIRIAPPTYTQTPNLVFEAAPLMIESELRVTLHVMRKTFGWHKRADRISLSQFIIGTGMKKQGVMNGIHAAMKRGIIERIRTGNSFYYQAVIHEDQLDSPLKRLDQSTKWTSSHTLDSPLKRPKSVHLVDTQKKERNRSEKKPTRSKQKNLAAALQILTGMGINEPNRTRLARMEHVTLGYLQILRAYQKANPQKGAALFALMIANNEPVPAQFAKAEANRQSTREMVRLYANR